MKTFPFLNLPYVIQRHFISLLPDETLIQFMQTSTWALRESINIRGIPSRRDHSTLVVSNDSSFSVTVNGNGISLFIGYRNFDGINLKRIEELILYLDETTTTDDALKICKKYSFSNFILKMSKFVDCTSIFEYLMNSKTFYYFEIHGYIPEEHLVKYLPQLLKIEKVSIKNLDQSFPVMDLQSLQKTLNHFLQEKQLIFYCSKFEIIQNLKKENTVNVLAFENSSFTLHSYYQTNNDCLFYE